MIVDFGRVPPASHFGADVCIIGTGPAGLAIARELLSTSTSVVVLESGGLGFETAAEALNAGDSVGLEHTGLTAGRRRQFAGAANIWGAVCVELDASDFARRPWIPNNSGWPIAAADVAPYYDRARDLFKLERTDYAAADWRAFGMEAAAYDEQAVRFSVAGTTAVADLGKAYRAAFRAAPNVRVLLHASATQLITNSAGTAVERVEIRSLDGNRGSVHARAVVLCCGGIENARLLLLSRRAHGNGLGNGHDLVGRYLADHTLSLSGRITAPPGRSLQPLFRGLRRGRESLRPRFSLPIEQQAAAGVLNCMAQVHFDHPADGGFIAASNLRKALRFRRMPENAGRDVLNVLRHPRELSGMAYDRYLRGLHPAGNDAQARLECFAEQAPDADSRVTLGERRDAFGLPSPVVDWRAADLERQTIANLTAAVGREFARLGLGTIEPEAWLSDPKNDWRKRLREGFHHMGTTRMAASGRAGVVDADCRVHEVAGLYAAGTSVFPAAGYANPTLTIVALAIRLADHLKRRLRAQLPAVAGAGTTSARRS